MVNETTGIGFSEPRSDIPMQDLARLDAAIAQARDSLNLMQGAVEQAGTDGSNDLFQVREIPHIGRYVIPRDSGWEPLISIIHDRTIDIDFSVKLYPAFDAVVAERFNGTQLHDPLDDEYEYYTNLRDNIAAVRNFIMHLYYTSPPRGMTAQKARDALEQIASFVGDGLHNNLRLFGVIPNHNPTKPFISISEANQGGGRGAQYLYEKILEMQRHNNWVRPFWAVVALFGGKGPIDWMLPGAHATPFHEGIGPMVAGSTHVGGLPTPEQMAAMQRHIQELEARRAQLQQSAALTMMAFDLDAIGNHLLYTSDNMHGVAHLSEPVRNEAVDIARDILRKLKLAIGNLNILDGLKLRPNDDVATLGAIKGVAMVYERLLAWARGLDPSIMQHPSVLAANRAIGQLGYLSKLEAHKLAKLAGNGPLAEKLKAQLARIPGYFSEATDAHFGALLDKVERGIDTVMNRVHEVNGPNAMIGHKPSKDISFMNSAPTAGQAQTLSSDASSNKAKQQQAMIEAQDAAERAQAQRIQQQVARQAQQQGQQPTQPAARGTGRRQMQQAQQQQRQQTSANPTSQNLQSMTQAQRNAMLQRQALIAAQAKEQEEQLHSPQQGAQRIDPRILNPQLLQNVQRATATSNLNTQPVPTSSAAYSAMQRQQAQNNQTRKPATQTPPAQQNRAGTTKSAAELQREALQRQQAQQAQNTPRGGGRGI